MELFKTLICGGDFNVRLHRLTSKLCYTGEERASINILLMMRELGPSDIWTLNPAKRDYFFLSHPYLVYSRLDYFLLFFS